MKVLEVGGLENPAAKVSKAEFYADRVAINAIDILKTAQMESSNRYIQFAWSFEALLQPSKAFHFSEITKGERKLNK